VQRIGENDVSRDVVCVIVRKVNGWIDLKIIVKTPRTADSKEIFLSALVIDLEAPMLVVVVSVAKHRFRAAMNDQALPKCLPF
jgi:hypothetical protein